MLNELDSSKTKQELIAELSVLKNKIKKLEKSESQQKPTEMELQKSEYHYRQLAEDMPALICTFLPDSTLTYVNKAYSELFQKRPDELVGQKFLYFLPDEATRENVRRQYMALTPENPVMTYEHEVIVSDGTSQYHWHRWTDRAFFSDNGPISHFQSIGQDITERKQASARDRVAREVLELLNRPQGSTDTVRDILQLIQKNSGFEAVGIRLREGDDFPYYETNGFSEDFIRAERYLCARDEEGKIIPDGQGNPVLECMCGNILCGRTNSALPFYTEGGSFWSNSTTKLLASTTEEYRQARTRNRCNDEGYESVALIPLRTGDKITGLLQLNDRRSNQFTPEMIRFFEGLGASISVALFRKRVGEALTAESLQLQETNTALRVILQRREEDQKEIERKITTNIQKLVLPNLEKLRGLGLNDIQANCLDIVAANLQQVASPFLQNLAACFADFTPREIQVANMIRQGKTSKEIAAIFNSSIRSVDFHRDNIRKKLGLSHKKFNLRTFLMKLSE